MLEATKRHRFHSDLGSFEIRGFLEETIGVVFEDHADREGAEAVGDGEHDLLHLLSELVAVHGTAPVAVELVEDGVVERREILRRSGHVDAEVRLDESHGLERRAKLRPRQDAVFVEVQRRELLVHALRERGGVVDEVAHGGAVDYHHAHSDFSHFLTQCLLLLFPTANYLIQYFINFILL